VEKKHGVEVITGKDLGGCASIHRGTRGGANSNVSWTKITLAQERNTNPDAKNKRRRGLPSGKIAKYMDSVTRVKKGPLDEGVAKTGEDKGLPGRENNFSQIKTDKPRWGKENGLGQKIRGVTENFQNRR